MKQRPLLFALSFAMALPALEHAPSAAGLAWSNIERIQGGFHLVVKSRWTGWIAYTDKAKSARLKRVTEAVNERARALSERMADHFDRIIDFFEHAERMLAGANEKSTSTFGSTSFKELGSVADAARKITMLGTHMIVSWVIPMQSARSLRANTVSSLIGMDTARA